MTIFSMHPISPGLALSLLLLLCCLSAGPVHAQSNTLRFNDSEGADVDILSRMSPDDAIDTMTTREGSVQLLLSENHLLLQLTDAGLDQITEEIRGFDDEQKTNQEDDLWMDVLKSMLSSGVRTLLDHAIAYPLTDIQEISYRDGTLLIINKKGQAILEDMTIDDQPVAENFRATDAERFAASARELLN